MATVSRPLVVLAGPIHPDGRALLEREARVVVSDDETEAGLVRAAVEAEGILFRIRPSCTASLMAACKKLRSSAGTASAWTRWTSRPRPGSAWRSSTPPARTRRPWPSTR